MKKKSLLEPWQRNALEILKRKNADHNFLMGFILTPKEQHIWSEALAFYDTNIFSKTGKKLTLLSDEQTAWDDGIIEDISRLQNRFGDSTETLDEITDFQQKLDNLDSVLCPAGRYYYRVWNDGTVEGCPVIEARKTAGNVKKRNVRIWDDDLYCNQAKYCDCVHIYKLGLMREGNSILSPQPRTDGKKRFLNKMLNDIKYYFE